MRPRRGRTSSGEQAVEPALRALDGGIDRFDGGVERAGAGRALFGRGALHEGQLARALAAHAAAQSGLRVDPDQRSEEHTSELQSQFHLVCRLLLEKKKKNHKTDKPNMRCLY